MCLTAPVVCKFALHSILILLCFPESGFIYIHICRLFVLYVTRLGSFLLFLLRMRCMFEFIYFAGSACDATTTTKTMTEIVNGKIVYYVVWKLNIFLFSAIAPTRIAYGLMDFTAPATIPAQNVIIRNKARFD